MVTRLSIESMIKSQMLLNPKSETVQANMKYYTKKVADAGYEDFQGYEL